MDQIRTVRYSSMSNGELDRAIAELVGSVDEEYRFYASDFNHIWPLVKGSVEIHSDADFTRVYIRRHSSLIEVYGDKVERQLAIAYLLYRDLSLVGKTVNVAEWS